jgi:hypothetical protein
MKYSGRARLIRQAIACKKALVVGAAWVGFKPASMEVFYVPDYDRMPRRRLEEDVRGLQENLAECFKSILGKKAITKAVAGRAILFLGSRYDAFMSSTGPFSIGTVQEFEAAVASLPEARSLDAPPYTELLIQGIRGLAYRHPEYMLARDVEVNHDLFWQAEILCERHMTSNARWMSVAVENVQSLARSTILSCFSLIEATVSGVGLAHVMTHPDLDPKIHKKLAGNHGPLLDRLLLIPELIASKPLPFSSGKPPISVLFGEIKERRDAFVHCEPGPQEARAGFVKEQRFHDVGPDSVDQAVQLTLEVVETIWRHVHGRTDGPTWLRSLGKRAEYRRGLLIAPAEEQ